MRKFLITVVGPTAIGKTALAIRLARHFQCEIISCDSRQFYKEMQIGTAVPDVAELAAAPHHFIQHISIFENYSVGDYEKEALQILGALFSRNDFVVLVGGSGLYVDAILKGFDDLPDVPDAIRREVHKKYEQQGITYLQNELKALDPVHFARMDTANPRRLMRALEVCLSTGKPYSGFLKHKENKRQFTPILIGLEAERPILYDRINQRVDLMMKAGLLNEAKTLVPHKKLNALQTVGYRELFAYLEDETSLDFAVAEIKKNTRRFAKRQMTWFKRNDAIQWFDYKADDTEIVRAVAQEIEKNNV